MSPRLEFALNLVHRAGRGTLAHFQTGVEVESKGDATPVTVADRRAEEMIRRGIEGKFPGEAILGEEHGATGDAENRWVIDPIDGTKSFISGVPLYATLLAYEEAGVPVLGICYFPALDEILYATKGCGANWNGRAVRVSQKQSLDGSLVCCGGHRLMAELGRMGPLLKIAERAMATRTWSDAYGHALVATGRAEAMIDPQVSRWDISAMKIIVEEAGGTMTDFAGSNPFCSNTQHATPDTYEALSSNRLLHPELLEAFRS